MKSCVSLLKTNRKNIERIEREKLTQNASSDIRSPYQSKSWDVPQDPMAYTPYQRGNYISSHTPGTSYGV